MDSIEQALDSMNRGYAMLAKAIEKLADGVASASPSRRADFAMLPRGCRTCSCESTATGVTIHNMDKWLTSTIPCPDCTRLASLAMKELGRKFAASHKERVDETAFVPDRLSTHVPENYHGRP